MQRRVSRRVVLKRAIGGLLVVGPLAEAAATIPVYAYTPCDQTSKRVIRQRCQGPDLVRTWLVYDAYDPSVNCGYIQEIFVNHPSCVQEKTEVQSGGNGLLIAAELGYTNEFYGMLRARTDPTAPGPWEAFQFVHLSSDIPDTNNPSSLTYAIQSLANGLFVSTEIGYTGNEYGMLRARASAIGAWEQYQLVSVESSGFWAIKSLANGLYVSAELGYAGIEQAMLRARAYSVGAWEQYWPYGA